MPNGFTLIEAIIALLILAIGLLAVANLFVFSTYSNTFAYNESVALKAAEDTLEMLRSTSLADPKLSVGGTIVATSAPCATGCAADQNHIMGVYFVPVTDNGIITHYVMKLTPYSTVAGSGWSQRQFEVRWQVIGYPTTLPAAGTVTEMAYNAYDDTFPTSPTNIFSITPPDANGQTSVVVIVRVIPFGAKNKSNFAKRVQLQTVIARP